MTDNGFRVEMVLFLRKGIMIQLKTGILRIDKEKRRFTFTMPSSEVHTFEVCHFMEKTLKPPSPTKTSLMIPMLFNTQLPENQKRNQIKILVPPENHSMGYYFIETFNSILEETKSTTKPSKKRPPLTLYEDPLQRTAVLNKRSCEKAERAVIVQELGKQLRTGVKSPDLEYVSEEYINQILNPPIQAKSMLEASDPFETHSKSTQKETPVRSQSRPNHANDEKLSISTTPKRPEVPRRSQLFAESPSGSSTMRSDPSPRPQNKRRLADESPSSLRISVPYSPSGMPRETSPPPLKLSPQPSAYTDVPNSSSWKPIGSYSSPESPDMTKYRNRKLINTGNSCYFNATMQALSACHPLVVYCTRLQRLYKRAHSDYFYNLNENKRDVFSGFLSMIDVLGCRKYDLKYFNATGYYIDYVKRMTDSDLKYIRLRTGKINRDFDNSEQQDAHEYLITVLGIVDDVMEEIAKRDRVKLSGPNYGLSICSLNPASLFQMKVETTYVCQECGWTTFKTEVRQDICLTIEKECSIESLLPHFVKWSALEKHCDECKHTVASSCERIVEFPQCLIVNLKRYERVGQDSYQKKSCSVDTTFELEGALLGVVSEIETHPELDKTIPAEENKVEEAPGLPEPMPDLSPIQLKGGAKFSADAEMDDEIIIHGELEKKEFEFKCLTDVKQISRMLEKMEITLTDEELEKHIKELKEIPVRIIEKDEAPTSTKSINSDGSCFYRSISWCLTGSQGHHVKVRNVLQKFVRDNKDLLVNYSNYDQMMRDVHDKCGWATNGEIFAFCTLFNINVYTYLLSGWTMYSPREHPSYDQMFPKADGAIYLINTSTHYEPVLSFVPGLRSKNRRKQKNDNAEEGEDGDDCNGDKTPKKTNGNGTPKRASIPRSCKKSGSGTGKSQAVSSYKADPGEMTYTLASVVCHQGISPDKGHYIAYTKEFYEEEWLYCSDTVVKTVSREQVNEEASGSSYVLFYNRL